MKAPKMSADEVEEFLKASWVAKIATTNEKGTIRITPIWYEDHGSYILMNTNAGTDLVRNLRRNKSASLLIDSEPRPPSRGVHFIGEAEVDATPSAPDDVITLWARYLASKEQAAQYRQRLQNQARVFVRFYPKERITFDYAKV
jgi:PPOX class probable F420-dependent enzyme